MAITFREFLNTDPPHLAEIWRRQKRFHGLADRISHQMIGDLILAKPYFDRQSLILAFDDQLPVGFVLAGYCPNEDMSDWDSRCGVISQIRVVDHQDSDQIADELLRRGESFLASQGANNLFVGGRFPFAPYFQGIYGGSRVPGVLIDDAIMLGAVSRAGYRSIGDVAIFQRRLAGFRTTVDRQLMSVRRQFQISADTDPPFANWWEAITLGNATRTRFELEDRKSGTLAASVVFWDIQPLATFWGVNAMGMYDLFVAQEHRRCGLATFLVGEALRHLAKEGVGLVEAQSLMDDEAACGVFTKHGFEIVGKGGCYSKAV
ncbi:MAG: GNAT family N-acetyltransferase [Pirellulaceae bacterium]